jgi:hypothetical protein
MHAKIKAILDEADHPGHCGKARVLAATKPIGQLVADFQRQTTELRSLVMDAETDVDVPEALRGKLEFMHQTLAARDRIGAELLRVARDVTAVQAQTDRVFAEAREDIERHDAAGGPPTADGVRRA